jgi:hypothetical protein
MTATILEKTANIQASCYSNANAFEILAVPTTTVPVIPSNATALIVAVTTYDDQGNDHVVHR